MKEDVTSNREVKKDERNTENEKKGRTKGMKALTKFTFFSIIIPMSTNLVQCQTHKDLKSKGEKRTNLYQEKKLQYAKTLEISQNGWRGKGGGGGGGGERKR